MKTIVKSIPNTLTCLNLVCGCMGITAAFNGNFSGAFYYMLGSVVFDFLDGFAARKLNAYSPMGKELDSLADMVSFGVLPSVVMYNIGFGFFGFMIAVFSALRLAKFNIDPRQSDSFIGLPTPANALFFVSAGYLLQDSFSWALLILTSDPIATYGSYVIITLFSLLLVSEIPMFSLKFKSKSFSKNRIPYIFISAAAFSIGLFKVIAIPFVIIAYVILSIVLHLIKRNKV